MKSKFQQQIELYFKAGFPSLAIETTEEQLVINEVVSVCEDLGLTIIGKYTPADQKPIWMEVEKPEEKGVYLLLDFQTLPLEQTPEMVRSLKELIQTAEEVGAKIVFIGETSKIMPSFSNLVTVIEYNLPSEEEFKVLIQECADQIAESKTVKIKYDADRIALALRGLNTFEAKNSLFLSFYSTGTFDHKFIQNEKVKEVKKAGVLEISEPVGGLEQIGGLENLKEYMQYISVAFRSKGETPRGVLCFGVPGTGKSLFAKVVGEFLELPTIKFDFGKVKNSLVGESGKRLRKVLKQVESLAPAILHIDEIEKALAGAGTDTSGVSSELFGILLTWMQDVTAPIFIVGTANWMQNLDSALLRRFTDVFAVNLPHEIEREEIFKIHLKKRGFDPKDYGMAKLVEKTLDFTGSEIEKVVLQAKWRSEYRKEKMSDKDLMEVIADSKPIAKVQPEQIKAIQKMCEFAKPASTPPKKTVAKKLGERKI